MFLKAFKGDSRELQGYLKEDQRFVEGSFMAVSKIFERGFKGE